MIPRILHQTWKNETPPPFMATMQSRLRALHPDWEYRLWTDEDNRSFVKEHYSDFLAIYDALPKHIMRVDVIRYLIMDKIGGFYCDLDYEMLRPIDEVIQNCNLLLPLSREKSSEAAANALGNSVFASIPGHPFWQDVIADLKANPPLNILEQSDVEAGTGPAFLTRIYYATSERYHAFTPPRQWFHPPSDIANDPNYQETLRSSGSYGVHHCTGSWRVFQLRSKFPWLQKFKLWLKLRLPGSLHWLVQ